MPYCVAGGALLTQARFWVRFLNKISSHKPTAGGSCRYDSVAAMEGREVAASLSSGGRSQKSGGAWTPPLPHPPLACLGTSWPRKGISSTCFQPEPSGETQDTDRLASLPVAAARKAAVKGLPFRPDTFLCRLCLSPALRATGEDSMTALGPSCSVSSPGWLVCVRRSSTRVWLALVWNFAALDLKGGAARQGLSK